MDYDTLVRTISPYPAACNLTVTTPGWRLVLSRTQPRLLLLYVSRQQMVVPAEAILLFLYLPQHPIVPTSRGDSKRHRQSQASAALSVVAGTATGSGRTLTRFLVRLSHSNLTRPSVVAKRV